MNPNPHLAHLMHVEQSVAKPFVTHDGRRFK